MKRLLFIVPLLAIIAFPSVAANTTPPGANGQMFYNNNGQWGAVNVGVGLCLSSTAVGCTPITPVGGHNIVTPLNDPWVTPLGDSIVTPL